MKPWVWLFLVVALCGCGQEQAPIRPPDVKLPLLEPKPGSTVPLGKWVELVFEEHHRGPDPIPPHTVGIPAPTISQVLVRCQLGEEFHVRISDVNRYYEVTGTPQAYAANDALSDVITLRLNFEAIHARGPEQDRKMVRTTLRLAPESRTWLAGVLADGTPFPRDQSQYIPPTSLTGEGTMHFVWFRPYAAPAALPLPAIFQTP